MAAEEAGTAGAAACAAAMVAAESPRSRGSPTRREASAVAAAAAAKAAEQLAREVAEADPQPQTAAGATPAPPKDFRPASGKLASAPSAREPEAPAGDKCPTSSRPSPTEPTVRPYVATRRAIKEWRALGASRLVIKTILQGVQIPWRELPPRYRSQAYQLNEADDAWAKEELGRSLAAGYLRELTSEEARAAHCIVSASVTHSA